MTDSAPEVITPDAFARIEALVDAAWELPSAERADFIERSNEAIVIRRRALAMLRAMDASEGFLEADKAVSLQGQTLGVWRLLRPLGRGGMGEVWLGERADGNFEQHVAIKLLHRQAGYTEDILREPKLLARLQHPGIAHLIDASRLPDGRVCIVMEYVDGTSLLSHVQGLHLNERLRLFLEICEAVAFAHRHLIVHGDLKPENILVRRDGRVALLDFGIGRRLDATQESESGLRLTPHYAAPEQLSGAAANTQTDVFALGVLLYELISGQLPWGERVGSGALALLQRAGSSGVAAPSARMTTPWPQRRVRGDLDAIVAKAMQEDPGTRYASVEALVGDLRAHLEHHPVTARANVAGYGLRCWLRRHWLAAGVSVMVVIGLVGALAMIDAARHEALRERDSAQVEARRSKAVRDYLTHMFRDARQAAQGEATLTAKQVLDRAADRIQNNFADDPATQADVLKALGELHFYLDDYTAAEPLLRRWLEHESIIADPVAAADVRFTLAQTILHLGKPDEAAALLQAAQDFWRGDAARHADVLLTSRSLEARLQREAGDREGELNTLESALAQRVARSGETHFETASLLTNLGAAQIQAGRLEQGIATSRRALLQWRALGLDASNDALNTLNNLAAALFRSGDLDAAEPAFADAVRLRRSLFGPSAATAALLGNHARVLNALGRFESARELAREAESMAKTHAGDGSVLTQSIRISHAEILAALKRGDEAALRLHASFAHDVATLPAVLRLRGTLLRLELGHLDAMGLDREFALRVLEQAVNELGAAAEPFRARVQAVRAR
ncbi:MAG TPA: serine/threonine-protein kinase [Chiayiivirga sp.]|nr:serine/threonine-protein kinase [Chiayiivirga sp.]